MGAITIRRLDNDLIERLKQKARANHRSMEEEVREILARHAPPRLSGQAAVDYFTQRLITPLKPIDSLSIIREMRYGEDE
jgi:hypothetical protein